jgi:hypothetical protein
LLAHPARFDCAHQRHAGRVIGVVGEVVLQMSENPRRCRRRGDGGSSVPLSEDRGWNRRRCRLGATARRSSVTGQPAASFTAAAASEQCPHR